MKLRLPTVLLSGIILLLSQNSYSNEILIGAAKAGNIVVAQEALKAPSLNINYVDEHGLTPLYYAAARGHFGMVELLLDRGANVNAGTIAPLDGAARYDQPEMLKYLLERGAKVDPVYAAADKDDEFPTMPIHFSARGGYQKNAQVLIQHGANLTPLNFRPIDSTGDSEMRQFLLDVSAARDGSNVIYLDLNEVLKTPSSLNRIILEYLTGRNSKEDLEFALKDPNCSICKEDVESGEEAVVDPRCQKAFHATCLGTWRKQTNQTIAKACPDCHTYLPPQAISVRKISKKSSPVPGILESSSGGSSPSSGPAK